MIRKAWPVASPSDELPRAFLRLYQASAGHREDRLAVDAHFWAYERVTEIVATGGREAVDVIDSLLRVGEGDDWYLAYVGAGPIEDLLYTHGADVADVIAERCRADASWRSAVSAVYWADLPAGVTHALRLYLPDAG